MFTAVCLCLSACSSDVRLPENAVRTTAASGMVMLDGEPGWGIVVTLHPKSGGEAAAVTKGEGDKDGKFELATYVAGDGAPPGDYVLTFKHIDRSKIYVMTGENGPPDLFRGAYANPARSSHSVTIPADSDEPFDLGTIELVSPEKK